MPTIKTVFSHFHNCLFKLLVLFIGITGTFTVPAFGQAEVMAWGNITGIRKSGEPFNFESAITVVGKDWLHSSSTALEKQSPRYIREGNTQLISTRIDSIYLTESIKDISNGKAAVKITYTAKKDTSITGIFFRIQLPANSYDNGSVEVNGSAPALISGLKSNSQHEYLSVSGRGVKFISANEQLAFQFDEETRIILKRNQRNNLLELYLPVHFGAIEKGQTGSKTFTIKVAGKINRAPVNVKLDASKQGRLFEGFGGNFRLQNPKADPQVIDYCLNNMRVAWGRVEMPYAQWQPVKNVDPIAAAKKGNLNAHVKASMEMAQRLQKLGIPIILTSWTAPKWAIIGKPHYRPENGIWGNRLNPDSLQATYKGIADYIAYLKDQYGVDIQLFSFNESDLGINIRVTPEEHDALIKYLGAYFVSRGLKTKMLLGDNSDATTYKFIYPALNDPDARQYIGAISFHSWRGWDTETLAKWADAAKKISAPLIVGEGSIDAAAYNYPLIFQEESYAREEINLYLRLLSICQPLSILQWQLTADYSPLIGGGIFGNNEPLHPGQRFWNLKQLASTPQKVYAIPTDTDGPNITCAALGNDQTKAYAIHFVNNGTTRKVTVSGIPEGVKRFTVYVTSKKLSNKRKSVIDVINGQATFKLLSTSFTSLMTE